MMPFYLPLLTALDWEDAVAEPPKEKAWALEPAEQGLPGLYWQSALAVETATASPLNAMDTACACSGGRSVVVWLVWWAEMECGHWQCKVRSMVVRCLSAGGIYGAQQAGYLGGLWMEVWDLGRCFHAQEVFT